MSAKAKKYNSFEEAFNKLVEISNVLENDDVGLEKTLKLYEEAIELRKFCEDFISKTKLKISQINQMLDKPDQH